MTELTITFVKIRLVTYIFGKTNYLKIEIVIRNSRCFQNLHKSGAAKKYSVISASKYCTFRAELLLVVLYLS